MSQQTSDSLNDKIVKQIEYYFGDVNLSRDNFMKDQLGKEDGWIEIKTLLTFNRLKSLTENELEVADAVRNSNTELVEVSEDNSKIRRTTPLPVYDDEYKQMYKRRTVHLKGFPKDATLDQITEYCVQFGPVDGVQMRRFKDKNFKGCIFVIYKTVEDANKCVESTEKFQEEHELLRENKENYFKRKAAYKVKKDKKLANLKNGEAGEPEEAKEGEEVKEVKFEPGCILRMHGVKESTNYFEIKKAFNQHGKVEYVEIYTDKSEAMVRFASSNDLKTCLDKMKVTDENQENSADGSENKDTQDTLVTIGDNKIKTELVSGDEETEYWKMVQQIRSQFTHKSKQNKGKKFNKYNQGKGKPKRKYNQDNSSNKKQKVEA